MSDEKINFSYGENFVERPHPTVCSTCGKNISSTRFLALMVFFEDDDVLRESFGPYEIKNYAWCAECVLRAMGTSPK